MIHSVYFNPSNTRVKLCCVPSVVMCMCSCVALEFVQCFHSPAFFSSMGVLGSIKIDPQYLDINSGIQGIFRRLQNLILSGFHFGLFASDVGSEYSVALGFGLDFFFCNLVRLHCEYNDHPLAIESVEFCS